MSSTPFLQPVPRRVLAPVLAVLVGLVLLAGVAPALADEADGTDDTPASEPDPSSGQEEDEVDEEPDVEPFFADTEGRGHDAAVLALAEAGIIQGCEQERFCPDSVLTRGQWATMLANALELVPMAEGPFSDVDGNTHAPAINTLAAEGIANGCEDAAFCPQDPVTREQVSSLLVRAFGVPQTDTVHFDDLSSTHGDSVNRLASAGIAAGCSEPLNHFCSGDEVVRWQAATFLARTLGLVDPVELAPLEERRAEQERIDAEREAQRQAEREAERQAEQERLEAERAAADPWGISELSDERIAMWERLAGCESNNNWSAVSANGLYYGGLQFHPQTWRSVGGTGMPNEASREEQIYRAERLLEQPWATFSNQWPACSRMLGLG